MLQRRWLVSGAFLVALACVGCGSDDIASVEGTVTLDGTPLQNATVVFVPEEGRPAGATTDESGHYVLVYTEGREGAPVGKNIVRIYTARDASESPSGEQIPPVPERLPMKYNAQTTLDFTVEAGKDNVADFALESGGDVMVQDDYN